ncbi:MAG TPA: YidC/Oxa1 family insertase periplasmic-domain containing protein [Tepidisphaeraceae bacterium]|nr:YidC/Oxa1 family insertase periplasmic-domain containing protein [Tepidisphaeraceae bacterium]
MDNRRMITGMLIAMAIVLMWQPVLTFVGTKLGYDMAPPKPPTTQVADASTTNPSTQPVATTSAAMVAPPTTAAIRAIASANLSPAIIGSATANDPKFKMALKISPLGAGLDEVVLNEFTATARKKDPYVFQQPYGVDAAAIRSMASRSITLNGVTTDLSSVAWNLDSSDAGSATYSVAIADETGPALRIRKTYQIAAPSDSSQGYEVSVDQAFENLTDHELKFQSVLNGPTVPPREQDRGGERHILAGYFIKDHIDVTHELIDSYSEKAPTREYAKDKQDDSAMWAGATSSYFQAIAHPISVKDPNATAEYIKTISGKAVNIKPDQKAEDREVELTLATTDLTVPGKQALSLPMKVFFGPRQRKLLESDYYSSLPRAFDQSLVLTSGPCGYCTFQWLIGILVFLLRGLHTLFLGDWGLAIIGLVVLVRFILHPVTRRSQISMSRMSKMGPEVERLKKKYGDNKEELNKAMMGLYKEQGIAPILGCLPMLLQMPVWLALWQALQTTFELRHASFLWGLTWIHDLSKPDHLLEWSSVPFLFWTISGLNVLPILMGVIFWLQMKYQPKPASLTPEQEQQQKMMQFMMPVLFPLMLYSGPSGLNLYILTSTGIGIIESKIIRDHLKQREEAEKAGRVIIDAKPTRASKQLQNDDKDKDVKKKTGLAGWWQQLLEQAEQVKRDAEKRK